MRRLAATDVQAAQPLRSGLLSLMLDNVALVRKAATQDSAARAQVALHHG